MVLLLSQVVEQEKIAIQSRGDNSVQRWMKFNKKIILDYCLH